MSTLTDRRASWDAKESARAAFADPHDDLAINDAAVYAHRRERDVILLAEAIVATGSWDAMTTATPPDAAMVAEAVALAAAD